MKNEKQINEELIKFWDSALTLSEEEKEEIKNAKDMDYKQMAPAAKLCDAAEALCSCKKALDYGCGSGWASIIASKSGCADVTAVDIGENIIDMVKAYADAFGAKINAFSISPDWLKTIPDQTFDGVICSNVLDVVPLETSKEIIKELARVSTPDAKIIIGLNFYMPPEVTVQRGMPLEEDKYLFVNGVLRLLSLKDEDWVGLFSPYFYVEKLDYFAWPGEPKETRRLFYLKNKNNLKNID